ncbi:hypothetical protein MHM88_11335 [Epibacterium sp. MM17-32]|uniref:GP88 family protein n=1 Tax=Epibacterium sp. MM17-32 TaxID=2917734 RepID=UPI001EF68F50|nr:hypothetical protein [Epibacterium sp. MM17-32]MCG7628401.1 hypothetical protein [Epibacterium sp. MM17-32]
MIINGFKSKAAALRELKAQGFNTAGLLAKPESNPKVAKNGKVDVLTAPLHLAPFNLSGFQTCAQASKGCAAACLHTAGNPAYMAGKEASRVAKTRAYFTARDAFMAVLAFEIAAHAAKAAKLGMECGVRLNATSDLPWERRTINVDGQDVNLMDHFDGVQFYDYTKITKRALAHARGQMPVNYHLTFSKTEDNDGDVGRVLVAGGNVAVVASPERYKAALAEGAMLVCGEIMQATDGDAHDYRPADPKGCIVALKAKGDAKADRSGFVVR